MVQTHTRALIVVSVLLATVAGAAVLGVGPVAAQESGSDNPLDGLSASDEESADEEDESAASRIFGMLGTGYEYAARVAAGFEGSAMRLYESGISNPLADDPTNADHAASCQQAVGSNADLLVDGVNAHTTPSTSWNTTRVVFTGAEGDDVAIYALTDIDENATEATAIRAVDETNRTVDHTVVVEGLAAKDCDELVVKAADAFRSGDEPLDEIDESELVGKYCSKSRAILSGEPSQSCDITATYWMDESDLPEYDLSGSAS